MRITGAAKAAQEVRMDWHAEAHALHILETARYELESDGGDGDAHEQLTRQILRMADRLAAEFPDAVTLSLQRRLHASAFMR